MKKTSKVISVLFFVLVLLGFFGQRALVKYEEAIPKIAFGSEPISEGSKETVMRTEEIENYGFEFRNYKTDFHRSRLTDNQRLIYNALEYALEKGFCYVYVDRLLASSDGELAEILDYLALDSPFLEQNLDYQTGTFTTFYDIMLGTAELSGYYISVENFSENTLGLKKEALKKAEEIIKEMPSDMNEREKAEYLYRYTVSNVSYFDYDGEYAAGEDVGLYDGLIGGETHCDGSSNMLSLLYNMAELEAFEKMHTGEGIVGHTWNMVKLDGVWYNSDATALQDGEKANTEYYIKRNFAFEDKLQRYESDYKELYPRATENLSIKINAEIFEIEKSDFAEIVKKAFKENGERYAYLIVEDYSVKDASNAAQRLADSLGRRVTWYEYDLLDNRTLLLLTA